VPSSGCLSGKERGVVGCAPSTELTPGSLKAAFWISVFYRGGAEIQGVDEEIFAEEKLS
jgi:hypothetical protein